MWSDRGDLSLRAVELGKLYRIGHRPSYRSFREAISVAVRVPFWRRSGGAAEGEAFLWALDGVTFEIHQGEIVGIVGRNGAGKSTLLRILSRITDPTRGFAEIHGRVGSLLEVGTGFHPELTGRENVYLNGAILGMRRMEIDRKFDEIVAFSEVERFLDTPVKHYSSGMYMRLAFAVAAHLEPEVLLIDEILAVGDAAFQAKCLGKMGDVARQGRTVLFVSHNMAAIAGLCSRAILLEEGKVAADGPPEEVIARYLDRLEGTAAVPLGNRTDRSGDGRVRLTGVAFFDGELRPAPVARLGEPLVIGLEYSARDGRPAAGLAFEIGVYGPTGQLVFLCGNAFAGQPFDRLPAVGRVLCRIDEIAVPPGLYSLNVYCGSVGNTADWVKNAAQLQVVESDFFGTGRLTPDNAGAVLVRHRWEATTAHPAGR